MQLNIRLSDGVILNGFTVFDNETIEQLKKRLQPRVCRPPEEQCLIANGRVLDDACTVDVTGLSDGTTVQLMLHDGLVKSKGQSAPVSVAINDESSFVVQIKIGDSISHEQEVAAGDLVYSLKLKIEHELRKSQRRTVPFGKQRLLHGQVELQNGRKLRHYKLENGAVLEMQDKSPPQTAQKDVEGTQTVFVKTLTGATVSLVRLNLSTTLVIELKEAIQDRIGLLPETQRLIFGGKQLEDERTLGEYNIKNESTLHMVLRVPGGGAVD
ncbi:hypothetical protein AA0119_g13166 [Alternaria tenuissima]|uniref:Ubiquitin-like domain-containing protein n=1 Tax=Alternaria tenuissima TaxID=119927 RepID=A0AB37VWS4_9PLEO|nr:hypothetical protein AA0115_g13004 [Alternaria tenuissima]RYN85737.1 hypothetical protein AA0119_g13166 [Alternaria tenuissima]RYO02835.1 hypothetical protein AA0121_g13241 [Alternaria tenuissima]